MAEQTPIPIDKGLVVELASNGMRAVLKLQSGMEAEQITEQVCLDRMIKAGIAEQCLAKDRVARRVQRYGEDPTTEQTLELLGKPAVHGENGRLEWYEGMDPTKRFESSSAEQIDHYNRSAYVTIAKDQPFARIHPPTDGTPGLDLRGGELPPTPGKPAAVTLSPSVACDDQGVCRAVIAGVVMMEGQTIRIEPLLAVPGSVDFSTGNIRFDGDVQIGGGVCDRFIVRATGSVEIKQVIEAAAIDVGRDLRALGGMAAKEKGHVRVGGHLFARYLDNVIGTITGNLEVEREIIGCELAVTGVVQSSKAALIGGTLCASDAIHLGRVGSLAAVATVLDVGHVAAIEQNIAQQHQQRREAAEALNQLQAIIDAVGPSAEPALLDRRAKLIALDHQFELRIDLLNAQLDKARKVDVNVNLYIGPGVTILCGCQVATFLDQVRGPLRIRFENGALTCSIAGGEAHLLSELSQVRSMTRQPPKANAKVPQPA